VLVPAYDAARCDGSFQSEVLAGRTDELGTAFNLDLFEHSATWNAMPTASRCIWSAASIKRGGARRRFRFAPASAS